jgi:uncharacterized protein (DUF2235 family)
MMMPKKRIVVCADGTWNRPEEDPAKDTPTNVLRMARAIKPVFGDVPQQVFYDWGLGSYHSRIVSGATGKGLNKNIMDDYRYIVQNYTPGAEIFLFGFSRGAYTVRSLCGLINNCGVLKRPDARLIESAFKLYKRPGKRNSPQGANSVAFRAAHSYDDVKIRFVGVWDTVGAMGIPISFLGLLDDEDEFYDNKLGSNVQIARHALAIDELRKDFVPTLWAAKAGIDIRQVWFVGAHTDIGGGYKPDPGGALLSDIPLGWMVREARKAGLGIESHLAQSLHPDSGAKKHQSRRRYYRLKKVYYRDIEHKYSDVLIHKSVKERWDSDPKYRPPNLREFVTRKGWSGYLAS